MILRWCIYFCLVITFLMQCDGFVYAEWVALEDDFQSHPLQTAYIDPDTIHREGSMVRISVLIDWKTMQGGRTPTRFYSTTLTKLVDCAERRVRTLTATDFYGHMGTGEVIGGGSAISEGHWAPVVSGTITEGLCDAACGKQ